MQKSVQPTLDGLNGHAGPTVSLMTVSNIWDQKQDEDFVITTRQVKVNSHTPLK